MSDVQTQEMVSAPLPSLKGAGRSTKQKAPARSVAENKASAVSGAVARGVAVGEVVVKLAREHGNSWKGILTEISALTQEGRTAFRGILEAEKARIRSEIARMGSTKEARAAFRTDGARLSELKVYSQAVDCGFNLATCKDLPYGDIVTAARQVKNSAASNGPTARKGRTPATKAEKMIRYLDGLGFASAEEWDEAAVLIRKHGRALFKATKPTQA